MSSAREPVTSGPFGRLSFSWHRVELIIFAVAVIARLGRGFAVDAGGLTHVYNYDPSVYYAAAVGLVHGEVPYRDFVLVHPPGIALVEAPFALLGGWTTDLTGYLAAAIAIVVLSSFNAVLVARVARAMGLNSVGAMVGGLGYALWTNAVLFETTVRLEPVGNFFLLCGLLAFFTGTNAKPERARRFWVLAGLAFGAAVCIKLWWIVPIAAFLGWQLARERRAREVGATIVGVAAALIVIDGPFFLLAGRDMWNMIVLDQLARTSSIVSDLDVFSYLAVGGWATESSDTTQVAVVTLGALVLASICWRVRSHRPSQAVMVLLFSQGLQLWLQPVWFPFYADFVTVGICLLLAAAFGVPAPTAQRDASAARFAWAPLVVALALAGNLTSFLATRPPAAEQDPKPFPRQELSRAVAGARCVMTDAPGVQIQLNALSGSFENHCPNWVDVAGRQMEIFRTVGPPSDPVAANAWKSLLVRYLTSGDVLIVLRKSEQLKLTPALTKRLHGGGLAFEHDGYQVFRGTN